MKFVQPIVPVWILVAMLGSGYWASAVFETVTGGELNVWLYLTSFHYDVTFWKQLFASTSVGAVLVVRYALMILFGTSVVVTIALNIKNAYIYVMTKRLLMASETATQK